MVDNMGSLLQSFALKRILEEMNVQVEFLDIAPNEEDNNLLNTERRVLTAHISRSPKRFPESLPALSSTIFCLWNWLQMTAKLLNS